MSRRTDRAILLSFPGEGCRLSDGGAGDPRGRGPDAGRPKPQPTQRIRYDGEKKISASKVKSFDGRNEERKR